MEQTTPVKSNSSAHIMSTTPVRQQQQQLSDFTSDLNANLADLEGESLTEHGDSPKEDDLPQDAGYNMMAMYQSSPAYGLAYSSPNRPSGPVGLTPDTYHPQVTAEQMFDMYRPQAQFGFGSSSPVRPTPEPVKKRGRPVRPLKLGQAPPPAPPVFATGVHGDEYMGQGMQARKWPSWDVRMPKETLTRKQAYSSMGFYPGTRPNIVPADQMPPQAIRHTYRDVTGGDHNAAMLGYMYNGFPAAAPQAHQATQQHTMHPQMAAQMYATQLQAPPIMQTQQYPVLPPEINMSLNNQRMYHPPPTPPQGPEPKKVNQTAANTSSKKTPRDLAAEAHVLLGHAAASPKVKHEQMSPVFLSSPPAQQPSYRARDLWQRPSASSSLASDPLAANTAKHNAQAAVQQPYERVTPTVDDGFDIDSIDVNYPVSEDLTSEATYTTAPAIPHPSTYRGSRHAYINGLVDQVKTETDSFSRSGFSTAEKPLGSWMFTVLTIPELHALLRGEDDPQTRTEVFMETITGQKVPSGHGYWRTPRGGKFRRAVERWDDGVVGLGLERCVFDDGEGVTTISFLEK